MGGMSDADSPIRSGEPGTGDARTTRSGDEGVPQDALIEQVEPTGADPVDARVHPDAEDEFAGRVHADTNFRTPNPDDEMDRDDVRRHIEGS